MRFLVLILLASTGCIEGVDPNECHLDADCDGGRRCSAMDRCERPEDLVDVNVSWTLNGTAPTAATCARLDSLAIGAGDGGSGYLEHVPCELGTATLLAAPRAFTIIGASAYRSIGNGNVEILDQRSMDIAGSPTPDARLDLQIP